MLCMKEAFRGLLKLNRYLHGSFVNPIPYSDLMRKFLTVSCAHYVHVVKSKGLRGQAVESEGSGGIGEKDQNEIHIKRMYLPKRFLCFTKGP